MSSSSQNSVYVFDVDTQECAVEVYSKTRRTWCVGLLTDFQKNQGKVTYNTPGGLREKQVDLFNKSEVLPLGTKIKDFPAGTMQGECDGKNLSIRLCKAWTQYLQAQEEDIQAIRNAISGHQEDTDPFDEILRQENAELEHVIKEIRQSMGS